MKQTSDKVTVLAAGTTVTFPVAMDTTDYTIVFRCYDPVTLETIGCDVDEAFFTVNGFYAKPLADGVMQYQAAEYGTTITLLTQTGRLSRDWTAQRFYAELVRDLGLKASDALYGERFNIMNRAVPKAVANNSAILGLSYMSAQTTTDTSATEVVISNIRMQMGGPEERFKIQSTASTYIDMVDWEEYRTFRIGAFQNTGRIIWTRQGDTLLFRKSTSLSNYGTRTYRYARMPELVTGNAVLMDFPDSHMELALIEGKRILAQRYREIVGNIDLPTDTGDQATKKAGETNALEGGTVLQKAL